MKWILFNTYYYIIASPVILTVLVIFLPLYAALYPINLITKNFFDFNTDAILDPLLELIAGDSRKNQMVSLAVDLSGLHKHSFLLKNRWDSQTLIMARVAAISNSLGIRVEFALESYFDPIERHWYIDMHTNTREDAQMILLMLD